MPNIAALQNPIDELYRLFRLPDETVKAVRRGLAAQEMPRLKDRGKLRDGGAHVPGMREIGPDRGGGFRNDPLFGGMASLDDGRMRVVHPARKQIAERLIDRAPWAEIALLNEPLQFRAPIFERLPMRRVDRLHDQGDTTDAGGINAIASGIGAEREHDEGEYLSTNGIRHAFSGVRLHILLGNP
jgi:hypothetical protein